jgi:hypothetical protein
MNAPLDLCLPKQEFDRWIGRQRERYEWIVRKDLIQKSEKSDPLATIATCVVLDQDEPIVWVWQRSVETGRLPAKPGEITGAEGAVVLPVPVVTLPRANIYQSLGPR